MTKINSLRGLNRTSDSVSKTDLFLVEVNLLQEEAGFNVRDTFDPNYWDRPEVKAHIEGFAQSYQLGRTVPPMTVKVKDGVPYIRAGAHRLRGLKLAIENGAQIKKIAVVEVGGDEIEENLLLINENEGRPLTPLALAVIYGRFAAWGWKNETIAKEVNKTSEHVRQTVKLLELPLALKQKINENLISASYALELFNEHGHDAVNLVNEVIAQKTEKLASSADKAQKAVKVTKAAVKPAGHKIPKKAVVLMQNSFLSISKKFADVTKEQDGSVTLKLSADEFEQMQALKAIIDKANKKEEEQGELDLSSSNEAETR